MPKLGFVFPGQGSQQVGMGKDLYDAHPDIQTLFNTANEKLGRNLTDIMFEGPKELLTQTENAQPAIFLVSAALLLLLKNAGVTPSVVAGHSLGEITAYYAAGAISFEQALDIIKVRGESMASSHPSEDSAMAAIMGKTPEEINEVLVNYQDVPVVMANLNCPGQIVISGRKEGLAAASAALKENGAKVIPLPVSGAFHSPLMQAGADKLAAYINTQTFNTANPQIILNRTASPESDATALAANLSQQVVSSVRWIESMANMGQQVERVVEVGPGKVLSGLAKKCLPDFPVSTVNSDTAISELQSTLKEEEYHVG